MTVQLPPSSLQNVATENADDHRAKIKSIVTTEGVVAAADLAVAENGTPNMTVNVAAGSAFIHGDNAPTTQGAYHVLNDATVNLAIAAADATNPRKDIVILEVRDAFYSGADNDAQLRVVTGTPAASPVAPALPNNALQLALIDVPANDTAITNSQITDSRTRAHLLDYASAFPLGVNWASWTPTLTNMTLGNGAVLADYAQVGQTVHWFFQFTLGSTSAITGEPAFSPPVTISTAIPSLMMGMVFLSDANGADWGGPVQRSGTTLRMRYWDAGSNVAAISATLPFTWASTDVLTATGFYKVA